MKQYIDQINTKIKSRTKEQWVQLLNDKLIELRAYIAVNGEISFIAAFILGIFVVVFFKLAFAIFFVFALLFAMVWCLAESEIEIRGQLKSTSDSGTEDVLTDVDNKNPPIQ